ncbi:unnamed protein product [Dracunculus medinensis]|uniref:Peptidase M12B domain-containing protein n=1 Tax=Dracunculus medinensis TaxID=318479 RepID=A0A3P7SV54_DRAME|nr:unnamed protein product [Dracunculus medinensis]
MKAIGLVQRWLLNYSQWLPKHNHAVFLTKYDLLASKGDSSTQGMAYVGTMCHIGDSVSIVEDIGGMATAIVAIHEIVHSLGAYHDGINLSEDCDERMNYIMAPLISGSEDEQKFSNSFKLSKCSIRQIEMFLASLPGELITKQRQCAISFGSHYGICAVSLTF